MQPIHYFPTRGLRAGPTFNSAQHSRSQEPLTERTSSADPNAPPTYTDALEGGAPPSYEKLFGSYRAAVENKSKLFLIVFFLAFAALALIIVLTVLVLPMYMISIGSSYTSKCVLQPAIPILLIVGGIFGLVWTLSAVAVYCNELDHRCQPISHLHYTFFAIFLCWLGPSMVWTYGAYPLWDSNNESSLWFCPRPAYNLALAVVSAASLASLTALVWMASHCCKRWTPK